MSRGAALPVATQSLTFTACSFLFLDFEHWKFLPLSQKVRGYVTELLGHINNAYWRGSMVRVLGMPRGPPLTRTYLITQLSLAGVVSTFARLLSGGGRTRQDDIMARFAEKGIEGDQLANSVLAVLVGATVEMSEGTSLSWAGGTRANARCSARQRREPLHRQPGGGAAQDDCRDGQDRGAGPGDHARLCFGGASYVHFAVAVRHGTHIRAAGLDPPFRGVYRMSFTSVLRIGSDLSSH